MASFLNPKPTNPIIPDVDQIRELFEVLAKMNPGLADGIPEGSKRLYEYTSNNKTYFRFERYTAGTWIKLGNMEVDATTVAGYAPSTTAKAGAIPVYNSAGQLVGNITGNAPTATKLATARSIQVGGIAASTAQNFDGTSNVTIPINSITINNSADNAVNGTLTAKHGGTGRTDGASLDVVVPSLSGDVLAKAYGQIGQARATNYDANADSLIVEGLYMLNANTSANWAKNKWPTGAAWNAFLRVLYNGSRIHQEYHSFEGGAWMRSTDNKGAAWTGWRALGHIAGYATVYISTSGNDLNMGLNSSYPVRTFARAMQIAEGIHRQGNGQPYIYFRFGEGNWGNITIRDCPFLVIFQPYDGGTATAYSTTLPVFGNITVENSYFWFQTCVAGYIVAQHGATVRIMSGYKRIGGIQSRSNSLVNIESQNAATNLIDFTGGTYYPFYAYGGKIIAEYVHLRLCGNLTVPFMYAACLGSISVWNGRTIYDATSFSNSSKKYEFWQGSKFNSNQMNGGLGWLNALPGASAGTVDESCYINGRAMANVLKTGDTMTGTLNIKVNGVAVNAYDTGLNRNAAPAANLYRRSYQMWDAQNACMGAIQAGFTTAQRMHMGLFAQRVISGVTKYAEIGGWINNDGTVGGYAPTPAAGSNTNDIATTAWVRTFHGSTSAGGSGTSVPSTGGTLTNASFNSGSISGTGVKLNGNAPLTSKDQYLVSLDMLHKLCACVYYGMCPGPYLDTGVYKYNTWSTPSANGYIMCSFTGRGTQYWRCGISTSVYNSLNAGTVDCAFTLPVQRSTYFMVYDSACSGVGLGWKVSINPAEWTGSRPSARTASAAELIPGMEHVYLRIIAGDIIEAFGDLVSLADNLGLEVPDPMRVEVDPQWIYDFYDEQVAKIEADHEDGIAKINEYFAEQLNFALYDAEKMINALFKERGAEFFEVSLEDELYFTKSEIERELDSQKGIQLVALSDAKKAAYKNLDKEMIIKQAEYEAECERKVEEAIRIRDAVCEKAATMADMIVTNDNWNSNRCQAHLEDGKIVLGPSRETLSGFIERLSEDRLRKYDREVMRLEREKRFATRAMKRSKMGDTDVLSKYAGKQDEIENRLEIWDTYAAEITDLPNKKGYPWDGGGKATPWPEEPVFEDDA